MRLILDIIDGKDLVEFILSRVAAKDLKALRLSSLSVTKGNTERERSTEKNK